MYQFIACDLTCIETRLRMCHCSQIRITQCANKEQTIRFFDISPHYSQNEIITEWKIKKYPPILISATIFCSLKLVFAYSWCLYVCRRRSRSIYAKKIRNMKKWNENKNNSTTMTAPRLPHTKSFDYECMLW